MSYKSPHGRDFSERIKRYTRRQIRTANRRADINEDNIENRIFSYTWDKLSENSFNRYRGALGNVPNNHHHKIHNFDCSDMKDTDMIEHIENKIELERRKRPSDTNNEVLHYLEASKKQILRRGKVGVFRGIRRNK